jgi:hypothetical protein
VARTILLRADFGRTSQAATTLLGFGFYCTGTFERMEFSTQHVIRGTQTPTSRLLSYITALHYFHQTYFEFYSFNFVEMADLFSDVLEPLPFRYSDIRGRNYAEVKRQLSLSNDPDKYIDIPHCTITGLEFSVMFGDWKMFLIFFLAGADPDQNLFDGIVQVSSTGELIILYEAFRSEEGEFQPLPGFRGLQCILDDVVVTSYPEGNLSKMRATLWLTKQLHENSAIVLGSDMISKAHRNCLLLDDDFDWESSFASKVTSCLSLLKQISVVYQVPEAALHSVIEQRLHQLLHGAIRDCIKGIVGGLGPGLEEANEEEA